MNNTIKTGIAVLISSGLGAFNTAMADEICPQRGGVLRTVDMHLTAVDPTQQANPVYQTYLVYDSLIDTEYDLSLSPGLAEAMPEQIDDMTFVFKLRQGIKFHDGTDFNAEAVKYNVDRLIDGGVKSPHSATWKRFTKAVTVVDDHTVQFEFNESWPTFLWDVASKLLIGSPTMMAELGESYGVKAAAGTGPFMFDEFKSKDLLSLVRNPDYYREGEPCLDGYLARTIESGTVRILSLKKGDLDVINTFPESQFPQFEGADDITIQEGAASTLTLLPMNTRHPALADKRVRQAIQYAINGQEIIDNVYGGAGVEIDSIFPPWHPGYIKAEKISALRQDVDKAKALLAEAGFGPEGEKLVLNLATGPGGAHVQRGVLIQAQLANVGIDLKVSNISYGQALSNMYAGNYEMFLWQMLGGPNMKDYAWDLFSADGAGNYTFYNKDGGYQNARANELANEIVLTEDPSIVQEQIKELQQLVFEDVPYIFVNYRNHRSAHQSYVKNFKTGKLKGKEDLRRVWLDK